MIISGLPSSNTFEPINKKMQIGNLNDPIITNEKEETTDLSRVEEKEVKDLKRRDTEVRAHELAHKTAAGRFAAGGAVFELERGPDGRFYAVGGHVNLDVSEEQTPEATIDKMEIIKRAALAPIEPSQQDRSVAARAIAKEAEARREMRLENAEEAAEGEDGKSLASGSRIGNADSQGGLTFGFGAGRNDAGGSFGSVFNEAQGSLVDIFA